MASDVSAAEAAASIAEKEPEFVLTVRVESARAVFRAPKEDALKKDKAGKGGAKGKAAPKKPAAKGGKGKEEEELENNLGMRSAIVLRSFPDTSLQPKDPVTSEEGEAVATQTPVDGGLMSVIVDTYGDSNLSPVYAFETRHTIKDRMLFLDNVCTLPLLVSLVQCLGLKEQSKGYSGPAQEDTDLYGSVEIDLKPFLEGKTSIQQWTKLTIPASVIEAATAAIMAAAAADEEQTSLMVASLPIPELFVSVTLDGPLLTEEEHLASNIATITVEKLHSLPKEWADGRTPSLHGQSELSDDIDFVDQFTFNYSMPLTEKASRELQFQSNHVQILDADSGNDAAPSSPKRPPSNASQTGGRSAGKKTKKDDAQDLAKLRDAALEVSAIFSYSRSSFLSPAAVARFLTSLKQQECFVLELTAARNALDEKETEPRTYKLGKCSADFKALLKPGAKKAGGDYDVISVEPAVIVEEDNVPAAKGKPTKGKPAGKKGAKEPGTDRPVTTFQDTKTKLRFHITFAKPLTPPRPKLSVQSLLGPKMTREKTATVLKSTKAGEVLVNGINKTAQQIIQEILVSDVNPTGDARGPDQSERQKQILGRLLNSGQYEQFVQMLKPLVVQVMKTNFFRKLPGEEVVTRDTIANKLRVQMTEAVSRILGQVSKVGIAGETAELKATRLANHYELVSQSQTAARHHLDVLSMANADPAATTKAYFNYGLFSLRAGDMDRCANALNKAIITDPKGTHTGCRVVYVLLLLELDLVEEATTVVQALAKVSKYANHPVLLLVRALYHQRAEEDEESWALLLQAARSWLSMFKGYANKNDPLVKELYGKPGSSPASKDLLSLYLLEPWCAWDSLTSAASLDALAKSNGDDLWHECMYILLARMLMSFNLPTLAYRMLTDGRSRSPGSIGIQGEPFARTDVGVVGGKDELKYARAVHLAELYVHVGQLDKAQTLGKQAAELIKVAADAKTPSAPVPHALLHHAAVNAKLFHALGQKQDTLASCKVYLELFNSKLDVGAVSVAVLDPLVCMAYSSVLQVSEDKMAAATWLAVFQQMAKDKFHRQNAFAWLGVAEAAQMLGGVYYGLAEHALAQASVLDDKNPAVWGNIAHLFLLRQHNVPESDATQQLRAEAKDAFEIAMQGDLRSPSLLLKLETLLKDAGLEEYAMHCAAAQQPEIR